MTSASARPLNENEIKMLLRCHAGEDIRSSYRDHDRARQELRRRGFIAYEGKPKRWVIKPSGIELAEAHIADRKRALDAALTL